MAFIEQEARLFMRSAIEALNPDQIGVYGIYKQDQWIYVGRGDIRDRLLDHLNGGNSCITRNNPTHFLTEVTANHVARERELILELNPVCSQKAG